MPLLKTKPNDRPSCGLPRFIQRSQAVLKKVAEQNQFVKAELSKPSITTISLQYPPVPFLPQRCQEEKCPPSPTPQPLELPVDLLGVWLTCIAKASNIHHNRFTVRYWRTRFSTNTAGQKGNCLVSTGGKTIALGLLSLGLSQTKISADPYVHPVLPPSGLRSPGALLSPQFPGPPPSFCDSPATKLAVVCWVGVD